MATRKLLKWFENRRKSKTLDLAQRQIVKAIDSVSELENAIVAFSEGRKADVEKSIERLFLNEVEIDSLRRTVLEELTKGSLPPKYREDLKGLVEHLDVLADHVKDSARSIKILTDTIVPKEIMDIYVRASGNLVQCASALFETIGTLGEDPLRVRELADKVEAIEGRVDEDYLTAKSLFIKYGREVDVGTMMILRDLIEYMERAADMCADTADHLRILAAGETLG
ncbi:MAG: DUF47 domain-containing protein [Candidatus Bathyarchaeia archaeon]